MTRTGYKPGDFQGTRVSDESLEYDTDSGFTDTVETITTFTAPNQEPGEIWEITSQLSVSQDPGSGPIFLEFRDVDGDIIGREAIPEYEGLTIELNMLIPTYVANAGFSTPADSGAGIDIVVNNVSGSSLNFFVDTMAIRVRDQIDQTARAQHGPVNGFDSGQPS